MSKPIRIDVVMELGFNEAVYLDGELAMFDHTILAADVANTAGGQTCTLKYHELEWLVDDWPALLNDVMKKPERK